MWKQLFPARLCLPIWHRTVSEIRLVLVLVALLTFCLGSSAGQVSPLKPFTPDDMLHLEEFGETDFSSDGQSLAYVIKRAKINGAVDPLRGLNNNEHADVWVTSIKGGPPLNITNGLVDGSGYWAPRWSPDGEMLAMMGIKNGKIQLYLWTKKLKQLNVLTSQSVAPTALENANDPYLWTANNKLVFVAEKQRDSRLDAAISAWSGAREAKTTTASVLESGVPPSLETRPQKDLVLIDVSSRKQQTIATAANFAELRLSPDRRYLAFYKQVGVWRPDSTIAKVTVLEPEIYQPMISDFANLARTLSGVKEAIQGSLLWSPTGTELVLIGYDEPGLKQKFFRCSVTKSACTVVSDKFQDLDPNRFNRFLLPPMTWLPSGELLVFSHNESLSTQLAHSKTKSWWAIDKAGNHRQFFPPSQPLPTQILSEAAGPNLVALIAGELWHIGTDGKLGKKVIPDFKPKLNSIVWGDRQTTNTNLRTRRENASGAVDKFLIALGSDNAVTNLYLINTQTGEFKALKEPGLNTKILAVDTSTKTIAVLSDDENGIRVWTTHGNESALTSIVDINGFVRGFVHPKQQRFQYYGGNGELLNAWVILPTDYQENRRYPTIVWVYPGTVYTDKLPRAPFLQVVMFDLTLLAARGYAVLRPSIPIRAFGETQDVYPELSKGVLPAIDKVIELGIADPDRIGLLGHSYGGYATYGLVTQTTRFKAAVASAGIANWASLYGTFDARFRYDSEVHENLMRMWGAETIGMGGPPSTNMKRYFLNSPINFVEKVETPLLIIQGDFDAEVQIQQGEEFFTGLYRQNKRARFIRYFGEGHVVEVPANIRDMWNQMFLWFDEFLKPKESNSTTARN